MKKIYVLKDYFGGFKGISEEEANDLVNNNLVFGVQMEVDRGDDKLLLTLLKRSFMAGFLVSDNEIEELQAEYFSYVNEITGMETYPSEGS